MRIKLKDVDEEDIPDFGGRILKVDRKFLTPYRIPSSVEYTSKQMIPTEVKIDSGISEVATVFWNEEYNNFLSKNGPFKNRLVNVESKADLMAYSPLVSFYPQIPKGIKPDTRSMKLLLELGLNIENVNIVSIPDFEPNTSYESDLIGYSNLVKGRGREPMPILDMELEPEEFKRKFDTIIANSETGLITMIGLIYRNWQDNIQNYIYIWENRDKEILYYCLGVLREHRKASTMHILQSFGIDVFSSRFLRGPGGQAKKISNVDIYDKSSIGVLKHNEFSNEHSDGHMGCDCPLCKGGTLDDFEDRFGYNHDGELDGHQLQYAGKLHEFFASSNEFEQSREYIEENMLSDYFGQKEYLKPYIHRNSI